jgi:Rrf2 family protein
MLSMKAKYALRALMVMATSDKKMLASKGIAAQADVPAKFLEAILLELKNQGFVDSRRGIFGGYFLTRAPEAIMVGEVIRALDGTLAPLRCASVHNYEKCEDCENEDTCVIRKVMQDVRNAISGVLDTRSLADMMTQSSLPKKGNFTQFFKHE